MTTYSAVNGSKDSTAPKKVNSSFPSSNPVPCMFCGERHSIHKCQKLSSKPTEEKRRFILDNNLFFGCLRRGHNAKDCRNKSTCGICKKPHPTPLHEDRSGVADTSSSHALQAEANTSSLSCCVGRGDGGSTSMIVPVWISSTTNPEKETLVYALLDTQSSNTFVDQDVCGKLGVVSEPVKDFIPLERSHIPTPETTKRWKHLNRIAQEIPELFECEVGLLIGYDCSRALAPRQVITGRDDEPYGIKTDLGWSIVGNSSWVVKSTEVTGLCHRVSVKEIPPLTPATVIRALEADFKDTNVGEKSISQDDIQFMHLLNERILQNADGHLEMPLPFKTRPHLPENKRLALVRLRQLKGKFEKNPKFKADYVKFMAGVFKDGDAERAENQPKEGNVWYIPHQGVYHPRKPEKIRVVFDCSAKYEGTVLNDHLLTGPDLTNGLTGVLCRFRNHPIAVICDVEKIFHRFHVSAEDRDYLRILQAKNEKEYPAAANFIKNNFYVDDGLISVESVDTAIKLVREAQTVCANGSLHLHKFISNSRDVLESIPDSERASGVQDWSVNSDTFSFKVTLDEKPATRRGILSTVASVFDPLGFLAPFLLLGKKILQEMCQKGIGWDEQLPTELEPRWESWLKDLENLHEFQIPRCFIPETLGKVKRTELHHFSDASCQGYGQCSYIRVVTEDKVMVEDPEVRTTQVLQTKVVVEDRFLERLERFSKWHTTLNVVARIQKLAKRTNTAELINTYLAGKHCDFTMNVPDASHMGGVWERQIRTVRSVLSSVLSKCTGRLDDASLRTFFYEAMSIVNSRPLTTDNIGDPKSLEPLTPNHLLTMKSSVPLPPPGKFVVEDVYARKRWRRVQYLMEQFWGRWRKEKEYLANITLRQRWHSSRRNVKIGDIVILKEEEIPRNEWRLGRVLDVCEDADGLVRKATVQMGNRKLGNEGQRLTSLSIFERPIHKLVVLVESN
ncbi:hypothetical protein N1851_019891 [Merluccius polli]|uniref:DUF5641 domain-containing protein n=1 Tax=Merluccius polli TaxID=89951 RepID=A0AA47NYY5_MERPO|nr:hypothetical protein N1851_019891 [Merluccius polli]